MASVKGTEYRFLALPVELALLKRTRTRTCSFACMSSHMVSVRRPKQLILIFDYETGFSKRATIEVPLFALPLELVAIKGPLAYNYLLVSFDCAAGFSKGDRV